MGESKRRKKLNANYGQTTKIVSKSDYLKALKKYLRSLKYFVKTEAEFDLFTDIFEGMIKFNFKETASGLLSTYHSSLKEYSEPCVIFAPNLDCFAMNFSDILEFFINPTNRQEYKRLYSEKGNFVPVLLYSYDIEFMLKGHPIPEDFWHILLLLDLSKSEVKQSCIPRAFGQNNCYDTSQIKINIMK